jgi:ribosomal protein S18 acetylase RimI-like enzyme
LDDFIKQFATQYDRKNVARAFVAVAPGQMTVLGYYSLSSGAVQFEVMPEEESKKLPRHPVPVAHLGRLAVDEKVQGQGLGETLLMDALKRCFQHSQEMGIYAVEVYALDEGARKFYLKYGFIPLKDDHLHLYLPMKAIQKLGL